MGRGASRAAGRAWNAVSLAVKREHLCRSDTCEVCGVSSDDLFLRKAASWADGRRFWQRKYPGAPLPWRLTQIPGTSGCTMVAHHWNGYDHPLDIWWICRACNRKLSNKHDGSLTLEQARRYSPPTDSVPAGEFLASLPADVRSDIQDTVRRILCFTQQRTQP